MLPAGVLPGKGRQSRAGSRPYNLSGESDQIGVAEQLLDSFGAEAAIHVVIQIVEVHHRPI